MQHIHMQQTPLCRTVCWQMTMFMNTPSRTSTRQYKSWKNCVSAIPIPNIGWTWPKAICILTQAAICKHWNTTNGWWKATQCEAATRNIWNRCTVWFPAMTVCMMKQRKLTMCGCCCRRRSSAETRRWNPSLFSIWGRWFITRRTSRGVMKW